MASNIWHEPLESLYDSPSCQVARFTSAENNAQHNNKLNYLNIKESYNFLMKMGNHNKNRIIIRLGEVHFKDVCNRLANGLIAAGRA